MGISAFRQGLALDLEPASSAFPTERDAGAISCVQDAREGGDAVQHLMVERRALLRFAVLATWKNRSHREHVFGSESGIKSLKIGEGLDQESDADQQHQGKGNL